MTNPVLTPALPLSSCVTLGGVGADLHLTCLLSHLRNENNSIVVRPEFLSAKLLEPNLASCQCSANVSNHHKLGPLPLGLLVVPSSQLHLLGWRNFPSALSGSAIRVGL